MRNAKPRKQKEIGLSLDIVRMGNKALGCEVCNQMLMQELGYMYCIHCLIKSNKYDIEIWVKERAVG